MYGATLRQPQPLSGRVPSRKPAQRGASRMVAKEPLATRMPKPNLGFLKALFWPLLLLALGFATYQLAQRLLPYADRPISKISVKGGLSYINQQAVQQRIAPFVTASFFSVDLAGMRAELEQMPWIAHAEVRRVWPDQVSIRLEEQLPVARWGDEALLNNQGQAFTPRELSHYENLPQLVGPQRAQEQVMQQYQVLSQMLRPLGFSIVRLELRDRGSWFLTANVNSSGQGLELLLGRDHQLEKMRRFIAIYGKTLKEQIANIARVDLRYANGLAVTWREPSVPAADKTVALK
ncbi:cell division protein FtsQ/DivIB [Pseudomonas cavernae]|uniref:Cell division protein FtsQ n=1 Tax=Pseudomonas cavernae TaxID=2320867 RepID=A0A385Z6P9_9PSED|nr:cell division protein FtsQ/DivIB [Pseudomonas cavernae]AYC34190.1 cell division protein FtsQ/DivIB [Pseudomonas cavernae]